VTGSDLTLALATDGGTVLDSDALASYFGATRCACPTNLTAQVVLDSAAASKLGSDTLDVDLMIGSDCNDTSATTACVTVGSPLTLPASKLSPSGPVDPGSVFAAVVASASCTALPTRSTRLWAIARQAGTRVTGPPSLALGVGGAPPDSPAGVTAE